MLTPTDQSHFSKYLATLGVAVVAGSLGLGGYLLGSQSDLLIERNKLAQLTTTANAAIHRKQDLILFLAQWGPIGVGILVAVGIALVVIGLIGWRGRQAVIDEREDLERDKLRVELTTMTTKEREKKAEDEARDLIIDEIGTDVVTRAAADNAAEGYGGIDLSGSAGADSAAEESSMSSVISNRPELVTNKVRNVQLTVLELESTLEAKLRDEFGPKNVLMSARLGSSTYELDAFVFPAGNNQAYAIDLKLIRRTTGVRTLVAQTLAQVVAAAEIAAKSIETSVQPVGLFLVDTDAIDPDDPTGGPVLTNLQKYAREITPSFAVRPITLSYRVNQFASVDSAQFHGRLRRLGRSKQVRQ